MVAPTAEAGNLLDGLAWTWLLLGVPSGKGWVLGQREGSAELAQGDKRHTTEDGWTHCSAWQSDITAREEFNVQG